MRRDDPSEVLELRRKGVMSLVFCELGDGDQRDRERTEEGERRSRMSTKRMMQKERESQGTRSWMMDVQKKHKPHWERMKGQNEEPQGSKNKMSNSTTIIMDVAVDEMIGSIKSKIRGPKAT